MTDKKIVSILGSGAMGWGIGYVLSTYSRAIVRIWDRDIELIEESERTRQNLKYSDPAIAMPKEALITNDLKTAVNGSDIVLLAVPSFAVREVCQKIAGLSFSALLMISKGMEEQTNLLPFQVAKEVLGEIHILHLTGAGYGKEVHKAIPAVEALASINEGLLEEVKNLLKTDWLTIKTSTDLLGVQLAGALKNVMVIGIGLTEGGSDNPNLRVKLIEAGVKEMIALGEAMGARKESFLGPAGKGDLELSAHPSSRNYKLGQLLAERGISEIKKELREKGITVEGFHTARAAHYLAQQYEVSVPIIEEVYQVIHEKKDPNLSIQSLTNK